MNYLEHLIDNFRKADRNGANKLITQWGDLNGYDSIIEELLTPALEFMGDDWCRKGDVTIAQAYVAAKIAEDVLGVITSQPNYVQPVRRKAPVVIGNIEDDFHGLGRKMVGVFLVADGWDVYDLGNDVVASEFVDKALELHASVIGVSAMTMSTAQNIIRVREEIDSRNLTNTIKLAVGGAVFRVSPNLVKTVGADGTAHNAIVAPVLFNSLAGIPAVKVGG